MDARERLVLARTENIQLAYLCGGENGYHVHPLERSLSLSQPRNWCALRQAASKERSARFGRHMGNSVTSCQNRQVCGESRRREDSKR